MKTRRSLALAAAFGLSACVDLAPRDHAPGAVTPATFPAGGAYPPAQTSPPAPGSAPARSTAFETPAPWREVFVDDRLRVVIDRALVQNRDLRVAVAHVAAARAQYVVQRANLFPKLNATASASYGQEPYSVLEGGSVQGVPKGEYNEREYSLTAGVSAFQLDLFGKVRDATRAALDQYFATREARDAARVTLIGEVATEYLTLGADRVMLSIAGDTLRSGAESLALTKARFDRGVASDLDVAEAETVVAQARYDVAHLTTQVAQDRNALELVVGAPVEAALLPTEIAEDGVVLTNLPAGMSSRVLLRRPDVAQAEDQLKSADANIGAARAAFFPDISLTGSGGLTSLALTSLFKSAAETWTFAPTVTQPLFDFGANKGNLAYARAQRAASLATYEKAIQTAFREVSDALAQRGTIEEQLRAQQTLTLAAQRSYQLSNARYERGADTYLNALIAQRTLYAARQTLVSTRLAQAVNVVTLYTALGGGVR